MKITPYDSRQYNLMAQMIELHDGNRGTSLNRLINNLLGLLDNLESPAETWEKEFRTLCNDLEMVYAIMLDEAKAELDSNGREIIRQTLMKLKEMLAPSISEETTNMD